MRIYLVGYMGSGKTTAGKKLAKILKLSFHDLDESIEFHTGQSVSSLFAARGEKFFREIETEMLHTTAFYPSSVISTGGGTPINNNNMDWMLNNGIVVYLKASPGFLVSRLSGSKNTRPLIAELSGEKLESFISMHLGIREPVYQRAHLTFDAINFNISEVANQIKNYSR